MKVCMLFDFHNELQGCAEDNFTPHFMDKGRVPVHK
jgi:hypothetical protein